MNNQQDKLFNIICDSCGISMKVSHYYGIHDDSKVTQITCCPLCYILMNDKGRPLSSMYVSHGNILASRKYDDEGKGEETIITIIK